MTKPAETLTTDELLTLTATVLTCTMMDAEEGTRTQGLQDCGLQLVREIMRRTGQTDEALVKAGFALISRMADAEEAQS